MFNKNLSWSFNSAYADNTPPFKKNIRPNIIDENTQFKKKN